VSVVVALLTLGGAAAQGLPSSPGDAEAAELPVQHRPLVLLGTSGVRWSDVSSRMPALAGLEDGWGVANAAVRSVRAVTCPVDGWLTVSAGNRAADVRRDVCRTLVDPVDGEVPVWAEYQRAARADDYEAVPGMLGDLLAEAETPVVAIGPGAAIAVATSDGSVSGWQPRAAGDGLTAQVADALAGGAALVVVDLGTVGAGQATVAEVDAALGAALAGAGEADVLVASVADRGDVPELQMVAMTATGAGLLTSTSTRQTGIVLGTDITTTVLVHLGLDTTQGIGAPIRLGATSGGVATLVDEAHHASVVRTLVPRTYFGLVVLNLAFYAVVWFGLARPGGGASGEAGRRRTLRLLRVSALTVGSVPVGLLVANLVPWWRASVPALALFTTAAVVVALVVGLALAGPWRRSMLGSAGVVAGITAAVIVADVVTGARLQISAVIGVPTLAAGRFYGFNNTAFALATAATLLALAALTDPWVRAGGRRRAATLVAVVGVAMIVVVGAPSVGASFGGPPALIPAFVVLTLLVLGARMTWRRVGAVLLGAVAITAAFAVTDWLRPVESRTHLGGFVQTVIDGGLWPVVARKISANLHIIANNLPLTLLTLAGMAFMVAVMVRPVRRMLLSPDGGRYAWLSRGTALNRLTVAAPTLVPALAATATALIVGFAVNDSGISIPALGVAITVPLVIASAAAWLSSLGPGTGPGTAAAALPVPDDAAPSPGQSPDDGSRRAARWRYRPVSTLLRPHGLRRWARALPDLSPRGGAPVLRRVRAGVAVAFGVLAATTGLAVPASAAEPPAEGTERPLVLIGVSGLRWDDVGTLATPELWDLSRNNAVGQVVVRSARARACPADGWLAVSSGSRVADNGVRRGCRTLHDPVGPSTAPWLAAWPDYLDSAEQQAYDARPGLLGDRLREHGLVASAIGPGAAIALADSTGVVAGAYEPRPERASRLTAAVQDALVSSSLVVVDAGTLRDPGYETVDPPSDPPVCLEPPAEPGDTATEPPGSDALTEPSRAEQAEAIDERIGAVLAATADRDVTVIVVSLANSGPSSLHLAVVDGVLPGADEPATGLLTSASTRQAGLILTTDVLPTLLRGLGIDDPGAPGASVTTTKGADTASARMAHLNDMALQAVQITRTSSGFVNRLMLAQVLLVGVAALVLTRASRSPRGTVEDWFGHRALPALRVTAIVLAAVPVSSLLVNLVPWWRSSVPRAAFWLTLAGFVALITVAALGGPWRRSRLAPLGVVAAVTVAVLAADAALGGRLIVDSAMDAHRLLGARFYGVGNHGFAMLTVAGLVLAALVARWFVARGRRTAAWTSVAGIGLVLAVLVAAPGMGSNFGGPGPLIVAFVLLAFLVAGRRVRWLPALGVLVAAAAVVLGFAMLDYSRPPDERTHVGRFVATVMAGGLWPVIGRKLEVNLRLLGSMRYVLPTLAGGLLTLWLVGGPRRWGLPRLPRGGLAGLVRAEPLLRPVAAAAAVGLTLATLVNDSGIVIPATGLAVGVPLLVALTASWLSERAGASSEQASASTLEPSPGGPGA